MKFKHFFIRYIAGLLAVSALNAAEPLFKLDFEALPAGLKGKGELVSSKPGYGKAMKFSNNTHIALKSTPELEAAEKTGTLTFECWLYREEDDEPGFIVRQDGGFSVLVIPWDPKRINIGVWTSKGYASLDSKPCLRAGVWQHIGIVITPKSAELLIDGHSQFKRPLPAPMRLCKRPIVIGAGYNGAKEELIHPLPCLMDAVELTAEAKGKEWFEKIAASTSENFEATQTEIGMPPDCAPGHTITKRVAPTITETPQTATIENSFYRLELAIAPSLRLKRLFNKFTQSECFTPKGSPLFAMEIARKKVNPSLFKIQKHSWKKENEKQILTAILAHPESGVEITLTLGFDNSQDITIDSSVRNGDKSQRLMPCVPMVENISIGPDFNENYYFWPQLTGWVGKKSYELGMAYGVRCWIQLADVFSPTLGGGLALSGQDTTGAVKGIVSRKTKKNGKIGINYNLLWLPGDAETIRIFEENSPGCAMAFVDYPNTYAAKEIRKLPPAKLSVHQGSVLNPLMHYAQWCKKAFPHASIPAAAKEEFNMVAVHRKSGNTGYNNRGLQGNGRYAIADYLAADGRDHNLQLAFWWKTYTANNKFSGEGDYEYDPTLGGKNGLKKAIENCNARDTHVVLYTCSRQVGNDSKAAQHPEWQYHSKPGVPANNWGSFNPCTEVPEWQDMFINANVRLAKDLPVSGVYLDTTAEILRCYNPKHKHPRNPADSIFRLLQEARTRLKAVRPALVIMTEYLGSEAFGKYIDMCWIQTFANPHAHAFNNYDLDFARFVYPKVKYAEWGMGPKTFEVDVRRAFFNGVGASRGDLTEQQNQRYAEMSNAQREMSDALTSENPQPFVPTLTSKLFANYFPGERQQVWTYYNKAGDLTAGEFAVAPKDAKLRFVEVLSDQELPMKNGKIALPMKQYDVGMIAAFPRLIHVTETADGFEIAVASKACKGNVRLLYVPGGKADNRSQWKELTLKNGKAKLAKTAAGTGKIIFKLKEKNLLLDETVLMK